ncbi:MAG: hypothetical protein M1816_003088 [Peltula sp. TS41687]|nr:MAG: hypothetical protein M1816_003088 [Peltula sp. TS41687]
MQPTSGWVQLAVPTPDTLLHYVTSAQDDAQPKHAPRTKRRRLTTTSESAVASQGTSFWSAPDGFISIFRRRLDILFVDCQLRPDQLENRQEWRADRKLPVAFRFPYPSHSSYRDNVLLTTTSGEVLASSKIESCSSQEILRDLQHAIDMGSVPRGERGIRKSSGITRSEFILIPSQDSELGLFSIEVRVLWRITSFSDLTLSDTSTPFDVLARAFPTGEELRSNDSSPQLFYDCVHPPEKDTTTTSLVEVPELRSRLYPFQKRAVRWLLRREGVDVHSSGKLCRYDPPARPLPLSFRREVDADGRECFVSHLYGAITRNLDDFAAHGGDHFGGILAEEMGLGKTVELIALILLHKPDLVARRPNPEIDPSSKSPPSATGGTLIVTPPHILQQWITELEHHAPTLKVFHYKGLKDKTIGYLEHAEILQLLKGYDVVLTTYRVLTSEVYYTDTPPDRQLRYQKKYNARRSPLISILWWRVCLDEAQMVELGLSHAAKVARIIPRCNAWAVTGTPVRRDVKDLWGLLEFLHYVPYCLSQRLWKRLWTLFPSTFQTVFGEIALRHVKDQVREELRLPQQKRIIINVPFTPVEEQHYSRLYQEMCDDCGVDRDGAPIVENWDPAPVIFKLRKWLTRLRQSCLHPQVGVRNRKFLGVTRGRPLRTVGEVLEVMIEQNEASIRTEERTQLTAKIRRGQLMENAHEPRQALDIWLECLRHARDMVRECRLQLDQELLKAKPGSTELELSSADGKRKDEVSKNEDRDSQITAHKQRLRAALELEHTCTFFVANAHYQIRSNEASTVPGSKEFEDLTKAETEYYEKARRIRRELLSEERGNALKLMKSIGQKAKERDFTEIPEMNTVDQTGGLESRSLNEKLDVLAHAMNRQADQLDEWRETVIQLLIQPLVDEDEGVRVHGGEEYDESTKDQNNLYVYMEALRAVMLDRHDAITGQESYRTFVLVRHLKGLAEEGESHNPELTLSLLGIREKLRPSKEMGSVRGILSQLRTVATALQFQADSGNKRTAAELALAEKQLKLIQELSMEQATALTSLERELALFVSTQNARLRYYRQLQQISDTVAPFNNEGHQDDHALLEQLLRTESESAAKVASLRAKARYLLHLRSESNDDDTGRIYKPQKVLIQEETDITKDKQDGSVKRSSLYSNVSSSTLNEIKNVELDRSWGTKIDMLARHIIWLRHNDPGAKSIVFSQYPAFLAILSMAFDHLKIAAVNIDSTGGIQKFQQDPGMEAFLLPANAQSSGLNLVNATHVFLCEPLVNTSIELQAIARVHRIGQHRPTTVWMYLITDTVEETIYDLSVSRRMAHIRRAGGDNQQQSTEETTTTEGEVLDPSSIDAADSLELPVPSTFIKFATVIEGGGEIVDNDDLWNCLFNKGESGHRSASRTGQALLAEAVTGASSSSAAGVVEPPEVQRERRALAGELRRLD